MRKDLFSGSNIRDMAAALEKARRILAQAEKDAQATLRRLLVLKEPLQSDPTDPTSSGGSTGGGNDRHNGGQSSGSRHNPHATAMLPSTALPAAVAGDGDDAMHPADSEHLATLRGLFPYVSTRFTQHPERPARPAPPARPARPTP